jgi:alcohol dehydrogenase
MRAWRVDAGGSRKLTSLDDPKPAPGAVVVKMEAAPVLSYQRAVLDGKLGYALPKAPFTPGTNGIGVVSAVGTGVFHLAIGQRVLLDPRLAANEQVAEPAQILIGLTAMGASREVQALQSAWPDGTFAESAHMPASLLTPLPSALSQVPADRLLGMGRFAIPYGGFLRADLRAGETVVVNGATGCFGSAAVLLSVALGATRVVAVGRDHARLSALAETAGPRVATMALTGDAAADASAIRKAAGGSADLALDIVGQAKSAASTSAALHSLRRGGRLVLMGSVLEPLALNVGEMLANDWQVMGCFMYPREALARLAAMVAAGMLDLGKLRIRAFPLPDLEAAMDTAAAMHGLDFTALVMNGA